MEREFRIKDVTLISNVEEKTDPHSPIELNLFSVQKFPETLEAVDWGYKVNILLLNVISDITFSMCHSLEEPEQIINDT